MNDLINVIRPVVVIVVTLAMYVFIVQLMNDTTCAALNSSTSSLVGKGFIELIAMCWWN